MIVLVIPDVHLKPWMFERAADLMMQGIAEQSVCLMDLSDDWGQAGNLDLYLKTLDRAIWYQKLYSDTLWCYGNHDLSYIWGQPESGFSSAMIAPVCEKLAGLQAMLPDEKQLGYVHRIDNVLFLHAGLTEAFVKRHAAGVDYDDADAVIEKINSLGMLQIWEDSSPIWFRPQFYYEKMYRGGEMLQVVGHTPVRTISLDNNVLSCDVFSTDRDREPIGTEEFLIIDTETWEYKGKKWTE